MAAPDWFGSNPDPVSAVAKAGPTRNEDASIGLAHEPSVPAGASEPLSSPSALSSCTGLLELSAAVLECCGTFLDPGVVALLDAARAQGLGPRGGCLYTRLTGRKGRMSAMRLGCRKCRCIRSSARDRDHWRHRFR